MSTKLRLGLLQYAVTRIESLAHYAQRFDALVAEGAAGAELLLMPEYACMEIASALTSEPDPMAELNAVCAHSDQILDIFRTNAVHHQVWLQPGTLPFRNAEGQVHNRAPLITPTGEITFQDKHVMTRFEAESWGVRSGLPPRSSRRLGAASGSRSAMTASSPASYARRSRPVPG